VLCGRSVRVAGNDRKANRNSTRHRIHPSFCDFTAGMLPAITDGMAGRVEDLICWQRADELRQLIIKHTADDTRAGKDFRFTNNLRDAIASVCRISRRGLRSTSTSRRSRTSTRRGPRWPRSRTASATACSAATFRMTSPRRCTCCAAAPTSPTCAISSRSTDRIRSKGEMRQLHRGTGTEHLWHPSTLSTPAP
jgi:hypothetical protein